MQLLMASLVHCSLFPATEPIICRGTVSSSLGDGVGAMSHHLPSFDRPVILSMLEPLSGVGSGRWRSLGKGTFGTTNGLVREMIVASHGEGCADFRCRPHTHRQILQPVTVRQSLLLGSGLA